MATMSELTNEQIDAIEARAREYAQRWPREDGIHMHDFVTPDDIIALVAAVYERDTEIDRLRRALSHRTKQLEDCQREADSMVLARLREADAALGFDKWDGEVEGE
jgi:hypothetical protein